MRVCLDMDPNTDAFHSPGNEIRRLLLYPYEGRL
ncbi:hypothetical protein SAMN05444422_1022 [Halobiforma haloterrestris]|uniref:Uncharacterized protein n=1 Tax=Natronobacterium haloterrestre TaxID=148448 RepID=A0A1I1DUR5_NATHA|nr:hypothetical protein SAMN05444422_1022 [Halobiforma haloterrestris]